MQGSRRICIPRSWIEFVLKRIEDQKKMKNMVLNLESDLKVIEICHPDTLVGYRKRLGYSLGLIHHQWPRGFHANIEKKFSYQYFRTSHRC